MQRPQPGEYAAYYQKYMDQAGDRSFSELIAENTKKTINLFGQIPEEKHNYSYAPGKWSVKDVLMHAIDTERGMSYRALVAARGDSEMPLATMDEDLYARNVDLTSRSMESLLAEFLAVRTATLFLLENVTEEQSKQYCTVSGNKVTVRALGYIIVGHLEHHINVVRERYL